ncbi:MAG: DUF3943 domain-containing protein [Bdellovibrionaceae bacterium]|nr:DUF3943 domain-containing protein [Pseudobdellovibrionaceae bacterium]
MPRPGSAVLTALILALLGCSRPSVAEVGRRPSVAGIGGPSVFHEPRSEFTRDELINDFALMYGFQWVGYLVTQADIIRRTGRFENMGTYPFRPHLDNDTYDYNVFRHAVTGNYYFLYYRSRGHDVKAAFLWSFASSMAFEFAIETLTERPSFQDMYHTPVLGTILGLGSEHLSRELLRTDSGFLRFLGYVFNPFAAWPGGSAYRVSVIPVISFGESAKVSDSVTGLTLRAEY